MKGDGKEHDYLCGQFTSKTRGVAVLCQYCLCPTEESDMPYGDFCTKSQAMVESLVKDKNKAGLTAMSQQYIWNAFYELRFGSHNDKGIHGACPIELLHWICIGQFGYTPTIF